MKVPQLILPGHYVDTHAAVTVETARAASLTVCANATSTDDARVILGALGLVTS